MEEFIVSDKRKKLPVAGCKVQQGVLDKEKKFKVIRGTGTIHKGPVNSLKHFKDEVSSVGMGKECGLRFQDSDVRFETGDVIICFEDRTQIPAVEWDTGF